MTCAFSRASSCKTFIYHNQALSRKFCVPPRGLDHFLPSVHSWVWFLQFTTVTFTLSTFEPHKSHFLMFIPKCQFSLYLSSATNSHFMQSTFCFYFLFPIFNFSDLYSLFSIFYFLFSIFYLLFSIFYFLFLFLFLFSIFYFLFSTLECS